MKSLRIYVDTSVFGGCFDAEFKEYSLEFIKLVKKGEIKILLSEVVVAELNRAPLQVQNLLKLIPAEAFEIVELTESVLELRDAYLKAGVLTKKSINDATHVAIATIARADAIVSWNFKHIVRLDKMKAFNQVNLMNGYGFLTIVSPREVVKNG